MNKPMTTIEAVTRFGCTTPDVDDCPDLLNHTCSYTCPHCKERIWFSSFVGNSGNPETAICPYCHEDTINPYPERR